VHVLRDVDSVVRLLVAKDISKLFRSYRREQTAYDHWLSTVRACLEVERALGSEVLLRIRHNDLVAEPEKCLRGCLELLGEDWDEAYLRPFDGMSTELAPAAPATTSEAAVAGPAGSATGDGRVKPTRFRAEAEALSRRLLAEDPSDRPPDAELADRLGERIVRLAGRGVPADGRSPATRVCQVMEAILPAEAHALVVSRGGDDLLRVEGRTAVLFQQRPDGSYLGYHPRDSAEAIDRLEALRASGAQYLVVPRTAF